MIGIIILISLLICALCLLIALLYIRQTEIEVKDKSVDLESVLPIQTITENAVINGNGDITVGYRLLLPEVFTLSESEAQYIHERLEALLKLLPAGTVIHQQNFYYTGRYHHAEYSSNALIAENNRHFNGKEILNSYTNLYVTFTNGSRNGKIRKSASGTSLMRKLHYPFKQPYKEYQQRLTEMEAFLMNFENGLSSIQQFEIRKMDDTELNNAIYDYVNLSYETPENDATQKSVNPMAVSESGSMKIGQQHVSILSLTNEGEHLQELAVPHTGKSKAYGKHRDTGQHTEQMLDAVPRRTWPAVQPHRKHRDRDNRSRCHRNGHRCGERRAELHHQLLPSGGREATRAGSLLR